MSRKIPDRWLTYRSMGSIVANTNIIAFKVPLKQESLKSLPPEQWFTPEILIEEVPKLGLIIDLTNTKRYYNKEEFTKRGVQYEKIFCRGQSVPSPKVVKAFFDAIHKFQRKEREEEQRVIGVHCTHGVNRTGYLIAKYLIDKLNTPIDEAIEAIKNARGHPIERVNYLDSLRGISKKPPAEHIQRTRLKTPTPSANRRRQDRQKNRQTRQDRQNRYSQYDNRRGNRNSYRGRSNYREPNGVYRDGQFGARIPPPGNLSQRETSVRYNECHYSYKADDVNTSQNERNSSISHSSRPNPHRGGCNADPEEERTQNCNRRFVDGRRSQSRNIRPQHLRGPYRHHYRPGDRYLPPPPSSRPPGRYDID